MGQATNQKNIGTQRKQILKQINKIMATDIDMEMYSTHNEGKSAVAERFIKTLKSKIYKYLTLKSKNL